MTTVHSLPLCEVSAGQPELVIATDLKNLSEQDVKFTPIVEARDSGVTESLSLHTSTLEIGSQVQVGVSWVSAKAGQYQLRVFVLSEFDDPQVLSVVASSNVKIAAKDSPGAC